MRTQKATETIMAAKDERLAERLRGRGWLVMSPDVLNRIDPMMDTIVVPIPGRSELDPCTPVCTDPAMHAEGGHDV